MRLYCIHCKNATSKQEFVQTSMPFAGPYFRQVVRCSRSSVGANGALRVLVIVDWLLQHRKGGWSPYRPYQEESAIIWKLVQLNYRHP